MLVDASCELKAWSLRNQRNQISSWPQWLQHQLRCRVGSIWVAVSSILQLCQFSANSCHEEQHEASSNETAMWQGARETGTPCNRPGLCTFTSLVHWFSFFSTLLLSTLHLLCILLPHFVLFCTFLFCWMFWYVLQLCRSCDVLMFVWCLHVVLLFSQATFACGPTASRASVPRNVTIFAVFARPGQCGQCNEDLLCVIESVLELADLQHFTDFTDLTIYFTLEDRRPFEDPWPSMAFDQNLMCHGIWSRTVQGWPVSPDGFRLQRTSKTMCSSLHTRRKRGRG